MRDARSLFVFIIVAITAVSCGKFRRIEKSEDWRVKYEAGLNYYQKKDYYHASALFENILPIVRGLPEGEKVQFYLAYCQFNQRLYILASEQFKTFFETYGRSSFAEEARYMYAYSLFSSSPNPHLDQTSSIDAMGAMQEFLNRYPNSKFKDHAIESIVEAQNKLEKKGFDNAYQYYKMEMYQAAVIALTNFASHYPDSKYIERAYFLAIDAEYKLAKHSIPAKQPERYRSVVDQYKEFLDRYPDSGYLKTAEKLYADSLDKLNKKKNINS
jgi:outer membrane protein assembly factor BamD